MTNLELAQEIYFALEEKQFDLEPAGFIATIESVLNKDLQRIAALTAERDGLATRLIELRADNEWLKKQIAVMQAILDEIAISPNGNLINQQQEQENEYL